MRTKAWTSVIVLLLALAACSHQSTLVADVRASIAKNDFSSADDRVQSYRRTHGETPELAAAISWLARGAVATHRMDAADAYSKEAYRMAIETSRGRSLDDDPWLPIALGNAMEVRVAVLKSNDDTVDAIALLHDNLARFGDTSLHDRIQKNINLLTLEGQSAPALEETVWFGPKPLALTDLHGKVVLLFFWAHWCPDCKAVVPVIARLMDKYKSQGLALIGPTKYYGYVANGDDAPPEVEKPYIDKIRQEYYAPLADMPTPLSNANFANYGASSTPTLALVDRKGIVRWYHPGAASEQELGSKIESLLVQ